MHGIIPVTPRIPASEKDCMPVCEWVMPATIAERDYARTCKALPAGMPDCLEAQTVQTDEGIERCTTAIYGRRAYLLHYTFTPTSQPDKETD